MSRGGPNPNGIYSDRMEKRKLDAEQVREIRASQASLRELAERFRVSPPTILNVKQWRTYKDVPDHPDDPMEPGLVQSQDLYLRMEALDLLKRLPTGWCETIATSPPPRLSASAIRQHGPKEARRIYVGWQREAIRECIRVAGPEGIVLYHHMAEPSGEGGLDAKFELVADFAQLSKIIVWQHRPPVVDLLEDLKNPGSLTTGRLDHPGPKPWTGEMPTYSFIYAFTGVNWSLPSETSLAAWLWGDVWLVEPIYEQGYRDRPRWVSFPDQLADRCVALGKGTVLDPFAAAGAIPLAAIRAGRSWLACDTRPALMAEFEERRVTAKAGRWESEPQLIERVNFQGDDEQIPIREDSGSALLRVVPPLTPPPTHSDEPLG